MGTMHIGTPRQKKSAYICRRLFSVELCLIKGWIQEPRHHHGDLHQQDVHSVIQLR